MADTEVQVLEIKFDVYFLFYVANRKTGRIYIWNHVTPSV